MTNPYKIDMSNDTRDNLRSFLYVSAMYWDYLERCGYLIGHDKHASAMRLRLAFIHCEKMWEKYKAYTVDCYQLTKVRES